MSVSTETMLDSVSLTLLDTARNTWSRTELLGYLNEGLRATAHVKPDMYVVREALTLAAGIAQSLPAAGVALIDITYNTASPKRAITQCDLALLQEENRFWPNATQQVEVENYAADPRDAKRFYVFPPNNGSGSVFVTYGAVPTALTGSSGEDLPVSDTYEYPLKCFMLAKAYMKNTQRRDDGKAAQMLNEWRLALGLKSQSQVAVAPKVAQSPGVA